MVKVSRPQHQPRGIGLAKDRGGWKACGVNIASITRDRPGACEICGTLQINLRRRLSLDHCHRTGVFRGWLCHQCNTALGLARESPEVLRNMAAYLETTREGAAGSASN